MEGWSRAGAGHGLRLERSRRRGEAAAADAVVAFVAAGRARRLPVRRGDRTQKGGCDGPEQGVDSSVNGVHGADTDDENGSESGDDGAAT